MSRKTYIKRAYANHPHRCDKCGATANLCVHHRNLNRRDNRVENLQILCRSCHKVLHNALGERTWSKSHDRCRQCGSSEQPHHSKGLCTLCYSERYNAERKKKRHALRQPYLWPEGPPATASEE